MEDSYSKGRQEDIYSQAIRAGKRTYFLDVKSTKAEELYLTITESKRWYNNDEGKYQYEKHKLFLFKEDFEKFMEGLQNSINFIEKGQEEFNEPQLEEETVDEEPTYSMHTEVKFEDLE
jgi:hypothetical protein